MKVVDNQSLDNSGKPKIVGFATWIFDHECRRGIVEPPRPKPVSTPKQNTGYTLADYLMMEGSDLRFLEDFRVKLWSVWPKVFDRSTDIGGFLLSIIDLSLISKRD